LDNNIEAWFEQKWQCKVNFEIDDALNKLLTLGIITKNDNGYQALPIDEAIKILDQRWDNYFQPF